MGTNTQYERVRRCLCEYVCVRVFVRSGNYTACQNYSLGRFLWRQWGVKVDLSYVTTIEPLNSCVTRVVVAFTVTVTLVVATIIIMTIDYLST